LGALRAEPRLSPTEAAAMVRAKIVENMFVIRRNLHLHLHLEAGRLMKMKMKKKRKRTRARLPLEKILYRPIGGA
jgi:hypothetical protein